MLQQPSLNDSLLLYEANREAHRRAMVALLKGRWFKINDPKEYFHDRYARPAYGGDCWSIDLQRKRISLRLEIVRQDETGFIDGYTHKDHYYCLYLDQLIEIPAGELPDAIRRLQE